MADDEKQTEIMRSGTDWEVVSLTSSAYAAAPNKTENISDASKIKLDQESSLFDSGHFVFPPSEHENLPIDALNENERKMRESEKLPEREKEEERQKEQEKMEEELKAVPQDQSFVKERSQETSSDAEKREDELKLGTEKKRDEEGKDGLEWIKKRGMWLYRHVKEANTVWSVMVAAALVGLVILGQRWQREKSQHQHQLK